MRKERKRESERVERRVNQLVNDITVVVKGKTGRFYNK